MANLGAGIYKDFFWIIVDTTALAWVSGDARREARLKHRAEVPGTELSVFLNNAGTEALVKVVAGDAAWRTARAWAGAIKRVFTEADKADLDALIRTAAWKRPDRL